MIFIANVLVMNGGTTFILRMAREYHRQGRRCAVLLLSDRCDPELVDELGRFADIIRLWNFLPERGRLFRSLLGVFAPLTFSDLEEALLPYGKHIHAMSVFGLILGKRLVAERPNWKLSVGVYHQNEFMFRPPPFYFAHQAIAQFRSMPAESVIFFNEFSRDNYRQHFGNDDYYQSTILPIGVSIDQPPVPLNNSPRQRIVSIGNLEHFKTYNSHMVEIVAELADKYPNLRYDIYGKGPSEQSLVSLIHNLGIADRVSLHGTLDYARIRETIAHADLFVGSGTALIEAAAVGRPALIGIKSIDHPETYGFLCDAKGYSYNENNPFEPKVPIIELVDRIFSDPNYWAEVARKCAHKAHEFSVARTVHGFDEVSGNINSVIEPLSTMQLTRMALSAAWLGISARFGLTKSFGERRNQSY